MSILPNSKTSITRRVEPLKFKAVFEVYPTLDITNHTDIPVEEVPKEVGEEEVDDTLKRMVEERAEMTPVEEDREIAEGDFVEISFKGTMEGEEDDDSLSAEKALCEIGAKRRSRSSRKI